jgi:hypothetical protein
LLPKQQQKQQQQRRQLLTKVMDEKIRKANPSPYMKANFLSKLFIWYVLVWAILDRLIPKYIT